MFSLITRRMSNTLFTAGYSMLTFCIPFVQSLPCKINDLIKKQSDSICSIDEISIPIWSLISSDVSSKQNGMTDFLMHCRRENWNNQAILSDIDEFELNYRPEEAIYWYTRDTFVHRMINRALRSENINMINKCLFLIRELHLLPNYMHQTRYIRDIAQATQIYYRGMVLSTKDLNKLIVDKLITFKSFASASASREVALMFAGNALIEIEVNNRTGLHAIFNSISDLSQFRDEEEVLFSIGNVFRVEKVQWCTVNSIWKVKLVLQKHLNIEQTSDENLQTVLSESSSTESWMIWLTHGLKSIRFFSQYCIALFHFIRK